MAQSGFTPIQLYRTATASAAPSAGNLADGELAINTNDGRLFYKDSGGVVRTIASSASTSGVFAPGTVSAPGITFTGDTNTGIYSPAADTIAFTEGGVEAMRLDASGNVSIGTVSGGYRLRVAGSAYIDGTTTVNNASFLLSDGFGVAWGNTFINGSNAGAVGFTTNGTERMRIDASGNVGIGTASPGNRLEVLSAGGTSQFRVRNDAVTPTAYYDFGRDGTDGFFGFSGAQTTFSGYKWSVNAGTEVMRITNAGNVGIGTSSPAYRLDVQGGGARVYRAGADALSAVENNSTFTSYTAYVNSTGTFDVGKSNGFAFLAANGVQPLVINTNASERMRIDASGNVGIGTSSPAARLDVNSTIIVGGSAGAGKYLARSVAGTTVMDFGVGTGTGFGDSIGLYNLTSTGLLTFGTNNTERVRIQNDGNVGIGTTSPTYRLVAANSSTDGGWLYSSGAVSILGLGGYLGPTDGAFSLRYDRAAGATTFNGGTRDTPVERMRLASNGQLLIGTTSAAEGFVNINGFVNYTLPTNFSGATGSLGWSTGFTSQPVLVSLYTSHSIVGNNVYSMSDIRLKEGVQTLPAGTGLEFVAAADPVSFTWKTDGTTDTGFIAQSLLAKGYGHLVSSVPDGAMEELQHEDGNVSPAGSRFVVRYDSIIPLLTAALKEQQAQIEELKARVAALENK